MAYDHKQVEEKWLRKWEEERKSSSVPDVSLRNNLATTADDMADGKIFTAKSKLYLLFAFAYPSGAGLHVGHVESKTALDILARYYRMKGKEVFFPVGWDAFGLPAENYAIKTGVPPVETTKNAINTFRRQIKRVGISYDWENEIATCHPGYYKWTQWLFLQLYNKGLAYKSLGKVNWCDSCQTVLANEQVVEGKCERCGTSVIQKDLNQWYFKITKYQDELISGLNQVDWPNATKQQQLNWIGKSKGLSIGFIETKSKKVLPVWTKFWETVFGVTFVVIAPERFNEWGMLELVTEDNQGLVREYLDKAAHKTEEQRRVGEKEKTGVDTGLKVINPTNGQEVPLFIADYVLMNVGTGVVMGVPSHDERDFAFAKKFNLPRIQVVSYEDKVLDEKVKMGEISHEGEGILVNSGKFDGMSAWGEGKEKIADWMCEQGFAGWQTTYKLRDWLISRQRYWGAPIPVVYDPEGNPHPVKEEHLPWLLPTDVEFKPTGESPLTYSKEFLERTERLYGKGWRPEFDTMDTFVDSSWYFLRYADARNENEFASKENLAKWLPADFYMIGPEHIVLHLLYARFFTKFLRDEGYLNFDEPFMKMRHQGMILGPDHRKMSKSKGNVIDPDPVIEEFGADTLRMYEMFMGPIDADKPWSTTSVVGVRRFLERVWRLATQPIADGSQQVVNNGVIRALYKTLKKVENDIPELKFNTAIAEMMKLVNVWEENELGLNKDQLSIFIIMLYPFAPFLASELWEINKFNGLVVDQSWPTVDEGAIESEEYKVMVAVNAKTRSELIISGQQLVDSNQQTIEKMAKEDEKVKKWLDGKEVVKAIFIPPTNSRNGMLNLIVKP